MADPVQQKQSSQPAEKTAATEPAQGQALTRAPHTAPEEVKDLTQPLPNNPINAAIDRHIAERHKQQDQQELYSSVWSGLAAVLTKTQPYAPSADYRRRVEQLVQELMLAEDRERKRKRGGRDETVFRTLVSLVGEKEAESIQQKIEALQKTPGSSAQGAAQLAKDIAAKLAANDSILSVHTGTQSVENPGAAPSQGQEMRRDVQSASPSPAEPLDIRHPLNHPVPEIRDALIQMAQPNVNPSGGHITLPEMQPIARQLFPAAQNLGFTGSRDQFTETLYMLSHKVESGQGMRADQILGLTEQSLSQNGQVANTHLVSIMTDALARIQYAKAASINVGEVAHFVLQDGQKPAQIYGQNLADHAAQALEGVGGFGALGSQGFGTPVVGPSDSGATVTRRELSDSTDDSSSPTRGTAISERTVTVPNPNGSSGGISTAQLKKIVPGAKTPENLEHDPEIALPPNSAAPSFKVTTIPDLTKRLKELGLKSAEAFARGDRDTAKRLETESHDTLHDNKSLIEGRSPQERTVIQNLAMETQAAELKRLEGIKLQADKAISTLQVELAKELSLKAVAGNADSEHASKIFKERSEALLSKIDPVAATLVSAGSRREAADTFLKLLSQKTAEIAAADSKVVEQARASLRAKCSEAFGATLTTFKKPGPELAAQLDKSAAALSAEQEKKFLAPEFKDILARNPEAMASLRDEITAQKKLAVDNAASVTDFFKRAETDLQNALQFNPQVGLAILQGPQGAQLLHSHLARLGSGKERVAFLSSMKISLGAQKFSTIVDAYDKTTNRPLALDIVEMSRMGDKAAVLQWEETYKKSGALPEATNQRLFSPEAALFTPEQQKRYVDAVQRHTTLILSRMRPDPKQIDAELDANARKLVEAKQELAKLLNIPESEDLWTDKGNDVIKTKVCEKFGIPKGCSLEEIYKQLPSKCDKITVHHETRKEKDPETGIERDITVKKETQSDPNKEEQKVVEMLLRFREINELPGKNKKLRESQVNGVDNELERYLKTARWVYGPALDPSTFSPEVQARFERQAEQYRRGLDERIAGAKPGQGKDALITERDALDWSVTSARVALDLDPSRSDLAGAKRKIEAFQRCEDPERSKPFAKVAEGVLDTFKAIEDYRNYDLKLAVEEEGSKVLALVSSSKPKQLSKTDELNAYKQFSQEDQLDARRQRTQTTQNCIAGCHGKGQGTVGDPEVFKKHLQIQRLLDQDKNKKQVKVSAGQDSKHLLGVSVGAAPPLSSGYFTLDKEQWTKRGGTDQQYSDLDEGCWQLQGRATSTQDQINSLALKPTSTFFEARPSSAAESKTADKVEVIQDALQRGPDAPLTAAELRKLREFAKNDPEIGKVFNTIPEGLNASDSKEESRLLLARLSPADQQRVRLLASQQERSNNPAQELWAAIKKLDDKDGALSIKAEAELAATKQYRVKRELDTLTPEERQKVEARFAGIHGHSIGTALIKARPLGGVGVRTLVALAGTNIASDADLKPFFPPDTKIPTSPAARAQALAKLFEADAKVELGSKTDLERFETDSKRLTKEVGIWTANLDVATSTGNKESADLARSEIAKLNNELAEVTGRIFNKHTPDYIARNGYREMFGAVHSYGVNNVVAAVFAPDSKYVATVLRIGDSLRDKEPNHVRAQELLSRNSFSRAESELVRVLYAAQESSRPVSKNERRLSGNLAHDLSRSKDPNDPETKRLELLVWGGEKNLVEYNRQLAFDGMTRKDQRDTLRGIVALKTLGAFNAVNEFLKDTSVPDDVKSYATAVKNNDTARQTGYELKSGLQTGVATAADALTSVKDLSADGRRAMGSVPGLTEAMPKDYKDAWGQIVNSETFDAGVNCFAAVGAFLDDMDVVFVGYGLAPGRERSQQLTRHLDAETQRRKEGSSYLDRLRNKNGWQGAFDAHVLKEVQKLAAEGKTLSAEQIAKIKSTKEGLGDQMIGLDSVEKQREGIHNASLQQADQYASVFKAAVTERDNSWLMSKFHGGYQRNIDETRARRGEHDWHLSAQRLALGDIRQTKRVAFVAGTVIVEDIVKDKRNGIGLGHVEAEYQALIRRDQARDCWRVVDHERHNSWAKEYQENSDSIRRWNIGVEIGHCVAKCAVIAGVSFFGSPLAGLAVATAWNGLDKTYRYTVNGESLRSVVGWGALELALDVVSFGVAKYLQTAMGSLKASQEVAGKTVQNVVNANVKGMKAGEQLLHLSQFSQSADDLAKGLGITVKQAAATSKVAEKTFHAASKIGAEMDAWVGPTVMVERILARIAMPGFHIPNFSPDPTPPVVAIPPVVPVPPAPAELPAALPVPPPPATPPVVPPVDPVQVDVAKALPDLEKQLKDLTYLLDKLRGSLGVGYVESKQWLEAAIASVTQAIADKQKSENDQKVAADKKTEADNKSPDNGAFYGDFGGLFQHDIFGFLNTGGIFTSNTQPIIFAPPQPPPPAAPPPSNSQEKSPPPPRPPSGPILSPSAESSLNTYVLEVMREQKLAEAKVAASAEQLTAAVRNQEASATQIAIATQQQVAQQQALAAHQAQAKEQATAQEAAVALRDSTGLQVAFAERQAVTQQQAASAQQQSVALAQSQSEPVRLRDSLSVDTSTAARSGLFAASQRSAASRAETEVEQLAQAALVEKPQSQKFHVVNAVRMAETPEQVAERAANDAQNIASAEYRATVSREKQRVVERDSAMALEQEAQRLVAQQAVGVASLSSAQADSRIGVAAATNNVNNQTQAPSGSSLSAVNMAGAELMPLEQLEAAAQAIEAAEQEEHQVDLDRRKARKLKDLKAKTRLREIISHQLQSMLFEQGRKQRMLRLLIALGISESEYRQLVARIGEMEAQAEAQRAEGRKQARAATRRPEQQVAKPQAVAALSTSAAGKAPIGMKESGAAQPPVTRVSRAELYVRMKE